MTILYAGGEDTSVTLIGTAAGVSGALTGRSAYGRASIGAGNGTTVADPPANRFQTPTFTAGNLIWLHAQENGPLGAIACTNNEQAIILRSPDGVSRIVVRQTATNGTLKVSSRNAAGTITDLATASGALTTSTNQIDLKVDYSSSGGVSLWINGTLVINYSGDPRTDSATQLNQAEFASVNNSGAATATTWAEIIIADEDTRGMALWSLNPQAAGNTQSWTPNTLANINKATINDATSISTSTNNALSEWTTPTAAPSGSWTVKAIVQEARVEVGVTGPQHFDWVARVAGTDYTAGLSLAPSTSFGNFNNRLWATNPATSAAWAITDIASGFNLGIKSLA